MKIRENDRREKSRSYRSQAIRTGKFFQNMGRGKPWEVQLVSNRKPLNIELSPKKKNEGAQEGRREEGTPRRRENIVERGFRLKKEKKEEKKKKKKEKLDKFF